MAQDLSINRWNIVISGFLQTEGNPTGMVRLWRELGALHSGPDSRVELRAWNDNWNDLAELIWRYRGSDEPRIAIHGYSWGGYSATVLARQLMRRGLGVQTMVLSDPVYRHWYKLGWWRSMVSWFEIEIPANVDEVHWFRQEQNLPKGHDLLPESEDTVIHEPVVLQMAHQYMDDSGEFREKALEEAA